MYQLRQIVHNISSQNNQGKMTGGVAQVIDCLLCKCKALSSNSSPTKVKNKNSTKNIKIKILQIKQHSRRKK
jgi:hypothetical protein